MRSSGRILALLTILAATLVGVAGADEPTPAEQIEAETHDLVAQCLVSPDPIACIVKHDYRCLSISFSEEQKFSCMRRYSEDAVILTVSKAGGTWSSNFYFLWHDDGRKQPVSR